MLFGVQRTYRFLITPVSVNNDLYYNLSLAPAGFWAHVRSDGGDIRVTAQDGTTQLPREVSGFDYAGHKGSLFIGGLTGYTACYIYYGNPSATEPAAGSAYGKYNVWESAAKAVFHLESNSKDSTSNQLDDTAGSPPTYGGADKVLNGGDFGTGADTNAKYILTGTNSHNVGTGDFAMTAWVYPTHYYNDGMGGSHSLLAAMANGVYAPVMYPSGESSTGHALGFYWSGWYDLGTDVALNTWSKIWIVRRSGVIYGYVNGTVTSKTVPITSSLGNAPIWIGRDSGGIDQFAGKMDEARFYSRAPSDAEIATDYANQNDPASFWTTGLEK